MTAYVIVEVTIKDPERYEQYRAMAPASVSHYGGRFLARGGETVQLEGSRDHERVVLLEFDSVETAQKWHASEEYRAARELRFAVAESRMVVLAGVEQDGT